MLSVGCQTPIVSDPSKAAVWTRVLMRAVAVWLPIAATTTGLAGLVYGAIQQDLRLTADDPQVALALRTAARLDAGGPLAAALPANQVDLASTLDPFVLVFDASGHMIEASATLDGQAPTYPTGVLETVRARGEDRVTWQPANNVREATVAVPWRGGFVVAGRSLVLTEQHIDQVGRLVAGGWIATLILAGVAALVTTVMDPSTDLPRLSIGPWRFPRTAPHKYVM